MDVLHRMSVDAELAVAIDQRIKADSLGGIVSPFEAPAWAATHIQDPLPRVIAPLTSEEPRIDLLVVPAVEGAAFAPVAELPVQEFVGGLGVDAEAAEDRMERPIGSHDNVLDRQRHMPHHSVEPSDRCR